MSGLPGYINGNVSTQFSDQIGKGLNLKRSALMLRKPVFVFRNIGIITVYGTS